MMLLFDLFNRYGDCCRQCFQFPSAFDPMGVRKFKTLLLLQMAEFLLNRPHKNTLGIFEILSFRFLMIYLISNSQLMRMGKSKISIIMKTSDDRAKRDKIFNSWVLVEHTRVPLTF